MNNELTFSIILNVVAIAFMAGLYIQQLKSNTKAIEDLKKYFAEKIDDIKSNFKEHLCRVEEKQDKHNSTIERTFCNERDISILQEQIKVANHRIDDLEEIK